MSDTESKLLFDRVCEAARELNTMNVFGALHIFVADGNCEDEHIESCLARPNITESERDFAERMLTGFTEEQRFAVYAFAQCRDLFSASQPARPAPTLSPPEPRPTPTHD